ncbi:MAG TPA: glycosyltransferase [Gemmatimonadaceae bacterium]|nr:glycosyltransferase [Gemmatimonadaceae bacterium]
MSDNLQLSVVVPACDSEATLSQTLAAIRASAIPRRAYELIVIDDVSSDASVAIAARYADTVVKLSGRRGGPGYARNRGAELARGSNLAFVDPDVVVRPETLPTMLRILNERSEIDAVSASHDARGPANFVSQYWNLLLRFGEERHAGQCAQFAFGCGTIRRNAFLGAGMYDEWRFVSGCLESAELGERLRERGHRVLLSSELGVTHLRRWDLRSVSREVWRRSRLLARSLGYTRMSSSVPSEVVFTLTRALAPAVALLGTLSLVAAFLPPRHTAAKIGLALAVVLTPNLPVHAFYTRARGLGFALAAMPLHLLAQLIAGLALCIGWILRDALGDPSPDATTQAYSEVGLEIWPPVPRKLPR